MLTHVNCQVACGSVRLPTHLTDVGLVRTPSVFVTLVGFEVTDTRKLGLALVAAQSGVCVALPHVKGQPIGFGKGCLTLGALEVSGCVMSGSDVVSKRQSPGEAGTTFFTAMSFVSHVGGHVTSESTLEDKLGLTDRTGVPLAPLFVAASKQSPGSPPGWGLQ